MTRLSGIWIESRIDPLGIDEPHPRMSWRLASDRSATWQRTYRVQVASDLDFGGPSILWDTGVVRSDATRIAYDGPLLAPRARAFWRVSVTDDQGFQSEWSATGWWEVGLPSVEDWVGRWISHREPDLISEPAEMGQYRPGPYLRRQFHLPDRVVQARAYVTALGIYTLRINGRRVGDRLLAPGWTDYRQRLEYQVYDVTELLDLGDNVVGAALADGWWAGNIAWFGRAQYGDTPALLAQLECHLADGSKAVITTDAAWSGRPGASRVADLIAGERIDGRIEPTAWDRPFAEASGWSAVQLRAAPGVPLVAARDEGVKVVRTFAPTSLVTRAPGRTIVDFGQNISGTVALVAQAPAGTVATVRFAEALDDDGGLYTANLRSADVRDEYTFRGDGDESFAPESTWHGFRYAEISGLVRPLAADQVEARAISSATKVVGEFACSDPDVTRVHENAVWSLLDNFISIPLDCPQRDERLGWAGDIGIFAPTALFVADVAPFLEKWLIDLADAQEPSGAYRDFAPVMSRAGAGNAAWADAGILVPWSIYQHTGDATVLDRQYDSMRRFLLYLEADHTDGVRRAGRYGDWVSLGARTPKDVIGTAYLARTADTFSRIARVVDRDADADRFGRLAALATNAFQSSFVLADGSIHADTQTAYALALRFDLLPDELRAGAADRLAALIRANGTHLATGFVGTPLLLPALSEHGHHDLACELMRQPGFPGWVFEVHQGATTIWERWDGRSPDGGFANPRMNSFNHYAFGSVAAWMHEHLAGLSPAEPGYRRVLIRPRPAAGFTSARASHVSLYGRHAVAWEADGMRLGIRLEIPPNTSGDVVLPVDASEVTIDGRPVSPDERGSDRGGNAVAEALFVLGSGEHRIQATIADARPGSAR
jgi:alpha-L-rhamnosidase